jgi:flagella basal body P-ring formation protein FlgA
VICAVLQGTVLLAAEDAQLVDATSEAIAAQARDNSEPPQVDAPVLEILKSELAKRWPGARIELTGTIQWLSGFRAAGNAIALSLQEINARGQAVFQVVDRSSGRLGSGWMNYAAWVPGYIARRRVSIGEKLSEQNLVPQQINAAAGNAYEYRGTFIEQGNGLAGLESRQTILEGQFLTSSAVQRIPDLRRGDAVRIRMISGDLAVSTQGTAEEPGYIHGKIRVMATKSKREFLGELYPDGVVEVRL